MRRAALLFTALTAFSVAAYGQASTSVPIGPYAGAAQGQLPGTATNDNANAGNIGELLETNVLPGSAVTLTSGTAQDIAVRQVTPGDWECKGNEAINPAGTPSAVGGWISLTSATLPTVPNAGSRYLLQSSGLTAASLQVFSVGSFRVSVNANTNVYLSTFNVFTSTATGYGYIGCRRTR